MKSEKSIYIFVGIIVLIVGAYFIITNSQNYKWNESYKAEDKNPYGTHALTELLKESYKVKIIDKPLNEYNLSNGNYFFIGKFLSIDSLQREKLLSYVKKGNNAYVFTNTFPYELIDRIGELNCERVEEEYDTGQIDENTKSTAEFRFLTKSSIRKVYKFKYVVKNEPIDYSWSYIDSVNFCPEQKVEVLGTINKSHINYYQIKYGKGVFIFHANPIVFSNYFLVKDSGIDYADKVFSDLNGKAIHLDEFNKDFHFNSPDGSPPSPLRFILEEPALKSAWYLIIALVLLYVLFYSKRKQRIIPVLEGNYNTSIEFTESIGKLYFLQNNHQKLALQKMKYFLGYIRQRYHYSTNTLDNNFIKKLSLKSGIPIEHVEVIFQQYKTISTYQGTAEDTLINFHHALEYFYQNCK